jgi:hypothetical protein
MSTRFDILDARKRMRNHVCTSDCAYPCATLRALSAEWQAVAGRWGHAEPGESHDDRQRRQYHERVNES